MFPINISSIKLTACTRNSIRIFHNRSLANAWYKSSQPEGFSGKGVLKTCSKYIGEHTCQSSFIEIALWHGCSPANSLHIFRKSFLKNTSGWLLLIAIEDARSYRLSKCVNGYENNILVNKIRTSLNISLTT